MTAEKSPIIAFDFVSINVTALHIPFAVLSVRHVDASGAGEAFSDNKNRQKTANFREKSKKSGKKFADSKKRSNFATLLASEACRKPIGM